MEIKLTDKTFISSESEIKVYGAGKINSYRFTPETWILKFQVQFEEDCECENFSVVFQAQGYLMNDYNLLSPRCQPNYDQSELDFDCICSADREKILEFVESQSWDLSEEWDDQEDQEVEDE